MKPVISTLNGLEMVRRRPMMYIGSFGTKAILSFMLEALCHALDEATEGLCNEITILYNAPFGLYIKYNYPMPLETHLKSGRTKAEIMLTVIGACSNLKKNTKIGDIYCQAGMAALTALCKTMYVYTSNKKEAYEFLFSNGKEKRIKTINSIGSMHTTINFSLDNDLLGFEIRDMFDELKLSVDKLKEEFPSVDFKIERLFSEEIK